jgi:hypothetical protein
MPMPLRAHHEGLQDVPAQSPAIGVGHVRDPALDRRIQLGERDLARVIGGQPASQPSMRRSHLARLDSAVGREASRVDRRGSLCRAN